MSDNLRQYRAIRDALRQAYPCEPQGRCARHLTTLAALISGIVASKSTQLPKVAAKGSPPSLRPGLSLSTVGHYTFPTVVFISQTIRHPLD
jgi:hypothetical protein